jgi:hypothetical protein
MVWCYGERNEVALSLRHDKVAQQMSCDVGMVMPEDDDDLCYDELRNHHLSARKSS